MTFFVQAQALQGCPTNRPVQRRGTDAATGSPPVGLRTRQNGAFMAPGHWPEKRMYPPRRPASTLA